MSEKEQHNIDKHLWDILDEFHTGYFELDKDKNIVYANRKMQSLMGRTSRELIGKNILKLVSRLYVDQVESLLDDAEKDKSKFKFLAEITKKDKTPILLDINGSCDNKNSSQHVFRALASDVTELQQKQADIWIKNTAIDRSTSAIIITDLNHNIYYANEAAYEMFKYKKHDSMAKSCVCTIWKDKKEYQEYKQKLENENEYNALGVNLARNDGSDFEGQIYASTAKDKAGKLLCYIKIINDITEELQTEYELQLQRTKFSAVLEAANQGFWDWDLITDKVYFSGKWMEQLGYKKDELPHCLDTFYNMVHPDDRDSVKDVIQNYIKQKKADEDVYYNTELRMKHKDESYRWILTRGSIIEMIGNIPTRFIGTHTDITEKKKYEELLTRKNKELEFFVHSASHDLQSPLVTLSGFANIILKEHENNCHEKETCASYDRINDSANEIKKAVTHLSETIEKLLQLSRMGKLYKSRKIINIGKTINQIIDVNKKSIKKSDAKITVINSLEACVQKETFISIIQNLLQNALCYARIDNRELKINITFSRCTDNSLLIMFSDNGPGIPEGMNDAIFEPFKRLTQKGNGLGLSIVKKGAEEIHNGSVCVENNIDGGATFYITLKDCFSNCDNECL